MTYHKSKGFGLLEVLISLLVISVGVAGIVGLQNYMRKTSAEAEEHLIAARLAQQALDDVNVFTDTTFSSVVASGALNILSGATSASAAGITFSRYVTVSDVAVDAAGGLNSDTQMKQVKVELKWNSLDGASKAQSLKMPVSPISKFETDQYFMLGKNGTAVGGGGAGGASAAIPIAKDPTHPDHVPPAYEANARYNDNDQVTIGGVKYSCAVSSRCRSDSVYGPNVADKSHFRSAWNICRDSDLNSIECPICYDAGGNTDPCPQCETSAGNGIWYYCPPTPEPSGEPSGEPVP